MDMLTTLASSTLLGQSAPTDDMRAAFLADVTIGLAYPQKAVPPRWFYDHQGSELFEEITRLPEYYPTRTEIGILKAHGADIAALIGPGRAVIEFGAGSAVKTPLLLDRIAPAAYVPVDISGDFLRESCEVLSERYDTFPVIPVVADFTDPVELPLAVAQEAKLGFFPGSTIGNLTPSEAVELLRAMRETLGDGAKLLIGMDLIKDRAVLEAAYDDAMGITAQFNLNLAERINRELGGTIPVEALRHRARWNALDARVEMHLEATRDIAFEVGGVRFFMSAGETIHTENSHKYDSASAATLLRAGGWEQQTEYTDADEQFLVVLAQAA